LLGIIQATEVIKLILGAGDPLVGSKGSTNGAR
jgi:hypothetical protein